MSLGALRPHVAGDVSFRDPLLGKDRAGPNYMTDRRGQHAAVGVI